MADTVKKSRIVSADNEENFSLEEIISEEFNNRLKCMSEKQEEANEEIISLTEENVLKSELKSQMNLNLNSEHLSCVLKSETIHSKENGNATPKIEEKILIEGPQNLPSTPHSSDNQDDNYINKEIPSPETEHQPLAENVTISDADIETLTAKERFLNTFKDIESDNKINREKLFLSTNSALPLFTQTIVSSPMLTPTEETYDFLQNLKKEESQIHESSISEISAENEICILNSSNSEEISDLEEEILKKEPSNFEETIKMLPTPTIVEHLVENSPENSFDFEENSPNNIEDLQKNEEIIEESNENVEEINKFEEKNEDNCQIVEEINETFEETSILQNLTECVTNNSTSISSESTYMESKIESSATKIESSGMQEKALKKKKSKKSKKDNEKENISVNELTNDEDTLSHVSVKNLCRSFSDLSSLSSKNTEFQVKKKYLTLRHKSMMDIRTDDFSVFNNVSVRTLKSSFSKFDALQKKTVLHVRSSDSGKAQEKFNGNGTIDTSNCKSCGKQVFQMEQMKAEKAIWHKNCFRCQECNKQLNVDTYQSNEGVLYCKPHFRALFTPKAVEDEQQPIRPRRHEMIIRENQPEELPPDVVRASDKPDLGLEELQNLNVKERFQVFEHHESQENSLERTPSTVNVKRSPSILSKLAKFQSKGMDIGVADDSLNGIPVEESSSEEEEEEEDEIEGEDAELVRARRAQREKPMHFTNMSDVMSKWESGNQMTKEERREERKQEIQSIRSRLFMGKQAKIKEAYQQAVLDSSSVKKPQLDPELKELQELQEGAKSLREKFERGESLTKQEEQTLREDQEIFEAGISKKSRSIFLEMDAKGAKPPSLIGAPQPGKEVRRAREAYLNKQPSEDVVRSTDQVDDVEVKTADISSRFKFFETYKEPEKQRKEFRITPPRENTVKMPEPEASPEIEPEVPDTQQAEESHTATRMLSVFRQLEESANKPNMQEGPKPLKRFTPPPEPQREESNSESEYSEEEEDDEDENADRNVDRDLIEAQKAARAKQLRAKFERWEANEIKREQNNSSVNLSEEIGDADSQIESAKSLRARFESMRDSTTEKERQPRVKVNRFVDTTNNVETCKSCEGRVYPLEKISCHNNIYHKNCFRCKECNCILRMDTYTYNQGLLYCLTHFKRLFISKGNYEAGFGLDQHKEKWNTLA